jgi:hypothetical protein
MLISASLAGSLSCEGSDTAEERQRGGNDLFLEEDEPKCHGIGYHGPELQVSPKCELRDTPFLPNIQVILFILTREGSTHVNSTLLKARKTVKEAKKPEFKPIVWQVDAYDRFSGDRSVSAQPVED